MNAHPEVSVDIQALGPDGTVVPIAMGDDGRITLGNLETLHMSQRTLPLHLVNEAGGKLLDGEVVVVSFHDIVDHALVSFDERVAHTLNQELVGEKPIRTVLLHTGEPVLIWARKDVPDLTLGVERVAGYRITRVA